MIHDKLENAHLYVNLHSGFDLAFAYLKNTDFSKVDCGKYEVDGNRVYATIQDYDTKKVKNTQFETHKKYIDIQYIIAGEERLGFAPLERFSQNTFYEESKDITFGTATGEFVLAKAGDFVVFYPTDAHMPSVCVDRPAFVKKVVVKVLV